MKRIKRIFSPILAMTLVALLSACGFQLRGAVDIAPGLKNLAVQSGNQPFQRMLMRSLERTGITVSESAPYLVDVISVDENERIESTTGGNIVMDYSVNTTVVWQMVDQASGSVLIPPQEMNQVGNYQREVNEFNAAQNAKARLIDELQESLVQAMTRRIASITEAELQAKIIEAQEQQQQSVQPNSRPFAPAL